MKKVRIFMNGISLNHDNERFRFYATTDSDSAKVIELGLDKQMESMNNDDGEEYGNGNVELDTDKKFVYIVWLNELSRIYAGNEMMCVTDSEKVAVEHFHFQWTHQEERWGFNSENQEDVGGDSEEPLIDFTESDSFATYRHADDCEQILGIVKIKVDDLKWTEVNI